MYPYPTESLGEENHKHALNNHTQVLADTLYSHIELLHRYTGSSSKQLHKFRSVAISSAIQIQLYSQY